MAMGNVPFLCVDRSAITWGPKISIVHTAGPEIALRNGGISWAGHMGSKAH